jgi:flagellar hook-associated protein 3 FlgL
VLASIVSSLNSAAGGRSLLAGNATDTNPLADVETFRSELTNAVAGATSVADVEAAVTAWFAPGGGFDTIGYTGSATPLNDFRLGDNRKVDMSLTAQDPAIAEVLKATAIAALVDEGVFAGDTESQLALVKRSGELLQAAQTGFTDLRARLGASQQAIELAQQSLSTEDYALQFARLEITAIDPFESAGKLDNVRVQLETLYSITARVSRLSLMEYLR